MRDERVEAARDGEEPGSREPRVRARPGRAAAIAHGDVRGELAQPPVHVDDAAVDLGELALGLGQGGRRGSRRAADGAGMRGAQRREREDEGERDATGFAAHDADSLRRLIAEEPAPSAAPSTIMPAAIDSGRNVGSTPSSIPSAPSKRERTMP